MIRLSAKFVAGFAGSAAAIALPFSLSSDVVETGRIADLLQPNALCAAGDDCRDHGCTGGWDGCYVDPDGGICLTTIKQD